jgi:methyl-galactoside transport system permease protein
MEEKMKDKFNSANMKEFLVQNAIYFVLGALLIGIIMKEPTFLSITNFTNILSQSAVRVIIALGIAGVIVTQGTDLSGGRQVGLAALISATLLQSSTAANKVFANIGEVPVIVVLLLVVVIGAIIGAINGVIVSKFHVTPFIATMGTMIIVYGANSIYFDKVGASPVSSFSTTFSVVLIFSIDDVAPIPGHLSGVSVPSIIYL